MVDGHEGGMVAGGSSEAIRELSRGQDGGWWWCPNSWDGGGKRQRRTAVGSTRGTIDTLLEQASDRKIGVASGGATRPMRSWGGSDAVAGWSGAQRDWFWH